MSRRRIYEEMGNPPMTSTDTKSVVATVAELRKMATSIYIAAEESVADDISARLTRAADLLERLSTLAPVDGGMELETTAEGRDAILRGVENLSIVVPGHLRDWFGKVIRDADKAVRFTALLAAEKAEKASLKARIHEAMGQRDGAEAECAEASDLILEARARAEQAEAALAASEAARVKAVEILKFLLCVDFDMFTEHDEALLGSVLEDARALTGATP